MMLAMVVVLLQIPGLFAHREIFYKQKRAGFYHPTAYSLAGTLVDIPGILIDIVSQWGKTWWLF